MRIASLAHNGADGTLASASGTALTLGWIDTVGHEVLALFSAALVILNVLHILVPEVVDRR